MFQRLGNVTDLGLAADCVIQQVSNVKALGDGVIDLARNGQWDTDFYVVTALLDSLSTTALVSAGSDADVSLEATGDAIPDIDLASASVSLRLKRSRNTASAHSLVSSLDGLHHLQPAPGAAAVVPVMSVRVP